MPNDAKAHRTDGKRGEGILAVRVTSPPRSSVLTLGRDLPNLSLLGKCWWSGHLAGH